MKVRELIQDLLLADPDLEVWVAPTNYGDYQQIAEDGFEVAYIDSDGYVYREDDPERERPVNAIVIWPGD